MEQVRVTPTLFEEYGKWYEARIRRERGHKPSINTLRTRKQHLVSVCNDAGFTTQEELALCLGDRARAEYLVDMLNARRSTGTVCGMVYSLLSFGDYAKLRGMVSRVELSSKDAPPRNPPKPIVVYSPREMELFVSSARGKDLRWWAFLAFLVDTGRRVGEVLSLEWEWFRLDSEPAYVELPTTKTGDPQYVPLSRRLREEVFTPENIIRMKQGFGRKTDRSPEAHPFPWVYHTVRGRFETFCFMTGLPNHGFHNFRHTVITERIARGVPIQAVAALAGHRSAAVTLSRYSHATALDYARFIDPESDPGGTQRSS